MTDFDRGGEARAKRLGSVWRPPWPILLVESVVAYIVWSIMKATMGIRLSKEAEMKGTDVSETGVIAYSIRD